MGGGDLNLKKSWHPNTAKNQEKVWKAEQIDAAEKRKLAELQKEISDERNREELKKIGQTSGVLAYNKNDDKKLEWMYQGSTELVNRDEYLLGRTIDKNFEQLDAIEKDQKSGNVLVPKNHVEHECIPFSIRQFKGGKLSNEQVDLTRKLMEDPVMAIKQKEMETRRKILENPVKLKELHRLLKNDKGSKSKKSMKSSKKSHKSKKSKKKNKSSGSEDSDGTGDDKDLDKILAQKYKKIQGVINHEDEDDKNLDLNQLLTMKYDKLSKELDKITKKHKKKRRSSRSSGSRETNDSGDDNDSRSKRKRSIDRRKSPEPRRPFERRDERARNLGRRDEWSRNRQRDEQPRSLGRPDERPRSPYRRGDRPRSPVRRAERPRSPVGRDERPRSPVRRDERPRSPVRDNRNDRRRENNNHRTGDHQKIISPSSRNSRYDRNRSRSHSRDRRPTTSKKRTPSPKSSSDSSSSSSSSESDNDDDNPSKKFGLISADGKKMKLGKLTDEQRAALRPAKPVKPKWTKPDKKQVLTEEEKERKRREMLSNAEWRDVERERNVQRYRDEENREKEVHSKEFDRDFITRQLNKAARSETVESRIKSNINNIQRSGNSMNSNFARR